MPRPRLHFAVALGLTLAAQSASASVIRVSEGAFTAAAGLITFSELPVGTVNPTFPPASYGGGVGAPTVTFGGYFLGQSPGSSNPGACPPGAGVAGCVLGLPSGPLALDPSSPPTSIVELVANPISPMLSGTPPLEGAIAILFSTPQFGVGLLGGFLNVIGGTAITAFDANGMVIGSVTNEALGTEFLGLVSSDANIAGVLFSLVGPEPGGISIDNLRFGVEGQVVVPEPATAALLGLGLLGLAAFRRRLPA